MTDQIQPNVISAAEDAWAKNMQLMHQVVAQMKEIPQLPSEMPKDSHALTKVEFPQSGGILTYMEGYTYPFRGFPYFEFVERIDFIKKISRATLSGMYHGLKNKRLQLLTLLPALWISKVFVSVGIYVFYRMVERFRIKKECYSQPIRELHRAFSMERYHEDEKTRELRLQMRDLMCMLLEFDNAYRYRFQDIMAELNQNALREDCNKELLRLFELMQKREKTQEISDTWKLFKLFIQIYMKFDRRFRRLIVDVFSQLNLNEIKLSVEDQYYCKPRKDYTFGFLEKDLCAITTFPQTKPQNGAASDGIQPQLSQSGHHDPAIASP